MAANATATKARMYPTALWAVAAITIAPASTMPWIEFAADISGVCKVAGTLLMTSKPTHRLSTKMTRSVSSAVDIGRTSSGIGPGGMYNGSVPADDDACLQFVGQVDSQFPVFHHVQQQRADVARVHGRR